MTMESEFLFFNGSLDRLPQNGYPLWIYVDLPCGQIRFEKGTLVTRQVHQIDIRNPMSVPTVTGGFIALLDVYT